MRASTVFTGWTSALMLAAGAGSAHSQSYPSKPVRIITAGVGAGNDFVARAIAPSLSAGLGQQIIVDNRANSFIAAEVASKAPADGYSMLFASSSTWLGPLLQTVPYDPVRDFSPITLVNRQPNILVVHPSLPARSVKALITLAKSRPGELNYANGGTASSPHLSAELFKAMAGVNIMMISYKNVGVSFNDLIGGQVQLMFPSSSAASPHVKSGRLIALAVTSAQPTALAPGLPVVAETVPGYEFSSLDAVFAPAKTPSAIISRLNQEIAKVLNQQDIREKFFGVGLETGGSTPEELAAAMKSETSRLGKIIKDAGIRRE